MNYTHRVVDSELGVPNYQVECRPSTDGSRSGSIWTASAKTLEPELVGFYEGHTDPTKATHVRINGITSMMGDQILRIEKI